MNSNRPNAQRKKIGDPLLNSYDDVKTEFQNFLGGELDDGPSEMVTDSDIDVGQWLQNSSMSQLSTDVPDAEHNVTLSDGNFLSVNPDTNMPMQLTHSPQKEQKDNAPEVMEEGTIDTVDSAFGLDANPGDTDSVTLVTDQFPQIPMSVPQPQVQHIQIVAIPVSTSNLVPIHSPIESNTIILDSNTGDIIPVSGATYIDTSQTLQAISNGEQLLQTSLSHPHPHSAPVLVEHLQRNIPVAHNPQPVSLTIANPHQSQPVPEHSTSTQQQDEDKVYPRPLFSYGCLIALALKNSTTGSLPVNEIYNFVCEHFPYYRTARDGWKNSVRHNLSMSKSFVKVHDPSTSGTKKGCLWGMNPARVKKMDEEIAKCIRKNLTNLYSSMVYPEKLSAIEQGQAGLPSHQNLEPEDEEEEFTASASEPLAADLTSTPRKGGEETMDEYSQSPLNNFDLEQEYAAHALEWCITDSDIENIDIDLLTSSPVDSQDTLQPHMPSSSVLDTDVIPLHLNSGQTASSTHLFVRCTPSAVSSDLLETTSPRTVSAFQG